MGDFPTEIVVDITSHLSFADKINLACTCKQLHRTISQSTHYNKLVLKKDSSLSDDYASFLKKKGVWSTSTLSWSNISFFSRRECQYCFRGFGFWNYMMELFMIDLVLVKGIDVQW